MNIWQKLRKQITDRPLIVLAPMADVTDAAFRTVISECKNPDMFWTEFVSADGLIRANPEGKKKLLADLMFEKNEHPIVAQLFGSNPENMEAAAYLIASLGFDGLDINMGCPDRSVEKQGSGAAMIRNPLTAVEIIRAAHRGVKKWADEKGTSAIPISVKTRIGYNKNELETWIPVLLAENLALITIHARTRKEMSKVPARWEHVAEAVRIRDELQKNIPQEERTLIFGNGDVADFDDGVKKGVEAGADGAMLGRAIFGNPWLFKRGYIPNLNEKLEMAIHHTEVFEQKLGEIKNFAIMKKHFKAYINGFDGAKELREHLMESAGNAGEVRAIIQNFLNNLKK